MADETFEKGLDLRRQMFGPEGAEKQTEAATEFTWPLQDMVTRHCFGEVWQREGLDHKTRSMLTISMLIALGQQNQIKTHVRGAIANGVSKEEIREILVHSIIYCGLPLAVNAFASANEVLKDLGLE